MKATSSPVQRWRIGEVEITRVLEFEAALFEPTVIHPAACSEIIEKNRIWLEPNLLDPESGLLVCACHSTIIQTPRATIMVDTCSGNDKERPQKLRYHRKNWPYLNNLAAAGFGPDEIDYVLCTHLRTLIMSVGTRDWSAADGCRRSPRPVTCLRARNGSIGGSLTYEPDIPPTPILKTACCLSWRVAKLSWLPPTLPLTTVYGSSRGRGTHPVTSASWCVLKEHP